MENPFRKFLDAPINENRRRFLKIITPGGWIPEFMRARNLSADGKASLLLDMALLSDAFLNACTNTPPKPRVVEQNLNPYPGIEWEEGEITLLASSMLSDDRFPEVVKAGNILLRNQQGEKVISAESSLFEDKRIGFRTVDNDSLESTGGLKGGIIAALIRQSGSVREVKVRLKTGGQRTIRGYSSLTLDRVIIPQKLMAKRSNFSFLIWTAKEIYNMVATDITTRMVMEASFDIPQSESDRNVLRTTILASKDTKGISYEGIVDIMAHFCVLADYNAAKDLGMLTPEDIQQMDLFELSTEAFESGGFLKRDNSGRYRWTEDLDLKNQAWYVAASTLYESFSKQ